MIALSTLLFLSPAAFAGSIINVLEIVGKSQSEVAVIMGEPISCGESERGVKCKYDKLWTEIEFINGKADWIKVKQISKYPFMDSTIARVGLKVSRPTYKSNTVRKWEPHQGLKSVALYRGAEKAKYIIIQAYTK